jgi:hypothetical protein
MYLNLRPKEDIRDHHDDYSWKEWSMWSEFTIKETKVVILCRAGMKYMPRHVIKLYVRMPAFRKGEILIGHRVEGCNSLTKSLAGTLPVGKSPLRRLISRGIY